MKTRPLLLLFIALGLSIYVTPALSQEIRTLTARRVLDVERGEAIENGVIIVKGDRITTVGRKGGIALQARR